MYDRPHISKNHHKTQKYPQPHLAEDDPNVERLIYNRIGGVMTSVLTLSAVDREFEQIKDYKIEICCFSTKHAALRGKRSRLLSSESG